MAYAEEHGLAKGLEEGLAKGLVQGRTLVAQNLKEMGMDVVAIQKATGLTLEEIQQL